ncbi:TetR family transcriptional regulator [Rhodobacteraceae bacterium NNCM2]|nr:TetR family transcriptional regulator [Coraliihabitans acroporae]
MTAANEPGEAQKAILLAAAQCFAERGFAATSIDMVARRMGYTKGRVYHYFRSKGELFIASASYGLDRQVREVDPEMRREGTVRERLSRMARQHVLTQIRDLPYHRVMLQGVAMVVRGPTTPDEREMLDRFLSRQRAYEGIFRAVLREGMENGEFRAGNLTIVTKTLLLALNGCCFWYADREDQSPEDVSMIADQLVQQSLYGLCGEAA